jgi:multidrug resistance efflux pump
MKMELPIMAPIDGVIAQLRCAEGRAVLVAQTLLIIRPDSRSGLHKQTLESINVDQP